MKLESARLKLGSACLKRESARLKLQVPWLKLEEPRMKLRTPTRELHLRRSKLGMTCPKLEVPCLKLEVPRLKLEMPRLKLEMPRLKREVWRLKRRPISATSYEEQGYEFRGFSGTTGRDRARVAWRLKPAYGRVGRACQDSGPVLEQVPSLAERVLASHARVTAGPTRAILAEAEAGAGTDALCRSGCVQQHLHRGPRGRLRHEQLVGLLVGRAIP